MEARKITVVSTKTQKKSVIMSGAETLAELKNDLREAGIDYEDMTFYEGTSKTELKADSSVLPKDVPYTNRTTGETKNTNELVFMLTNTNKKIKSGAISPVRAEAYKAVKEMGLEKACMEIYGKNYTRCSTKDLISLIQNARNAESKKGFAPEEGIVDARARAAIAELVFALCEEDYFSNDQRDSILGILRGKESSALNSPYSDNEIDNMFSDMC